MALHFYVDDCQVYDWLHKSNEFGEETRSGKISGLVSSMLQGKKKSLKKANASPLIMKMS